MTLQEMHEEEARQWFKRVVTDVPIFEGLFREALGLLEEGERPYMWLRAHIDGLEGTRILVTDRRLVVFRSISGPFEASQLLLEANYDLKTLSAPPSIQQIGGRTVLTTSFSTGEAQSTVTVVGIPLAIALEARRFLTFSGDERTAVTVLHRPEANKTLHKKRVSLGTVIGMIFSAAAAFAWLAFIPGLLMRLFLIGGMMLIVWAGLRKQLFQRQSAKSQGSAEDLLPLLWIISVYFAFIIAASISPKVSTPPLSQTMKVETTIEQSDSQLALLLGAVSPVEQLIFAWLGGVNSPDVETSPEPEMAGAAELTASLRRLRSQLWALSGVRLLFALLAVGVTPLLWLRVRRKRTAYTEESSLDSLVSEDAIALWALAISSYLIIIFYIPLAIALIQSVRTGWVQPLSLPDIVYILGWLPTGLLVLAGRRNGKLFGARSNARLWSGALILLGVASMGYWVQYLGELGLIAAMDWVGVMPGRELLQQATPLIAGSYVALGFRVFFGDIVAPFFEEISFRGWLYGGLRKVLKPAWAIPISAAAFSLLHGFSFHGFVQVFWAGVVYAYLYEKTHRLWPGILVHIIGNSLITLTTLLLYRGS